ncbi:MAG: GDSL-type esterase/lipase family protein [Gemmataceae bacterium]
MRCFLRMILLVPGIATVLWAAQPGTAGDFPLKDGDVWVMAGDSITAQHLHSNYFEAFCYARYPNLKFAFRNSGVGGHTIPSTLARFDYDIEAWKPTVVSVELGMNDKGGTATDKFIANMDKFVMRVRDINARPIIFAASPVNNGETLARLGGGNKRLDEYATALKSFADKQKIPYANQFHDLIDLWGKNKPRESIANSLGTLKQAAQDDSLAGVEHLRSFLAAQEKSGTPLVSMQGDPVHPGPPGQLMMATSLLKQLGADGFVSSATIDATGKLVDAKGCKITDIKSEGGGVAFDRLDQSLPFPIPDNARQVLPLYPTILELSQYTLKVPGLKDGSYTLLVGGVPTATLSAKELAAGVNLTEFGAEQGKKANPIVEQMRDVLNAVSSKEGLVSQWRNQSKAAFAKDADPALKAKLPEMTKKVEEADAKIRAAATPKKLHFEIVPAK